MSNLSVIAGVLCLNIFFVDIFYALTQPEVKS
jgi:hypothetical protein